MSRRSVLARPDLVERLGAVKLLSVDVDGVLTDGGLYFTDDGRQSRKFNVRDGVGMKRALASALCSAVDKLDLGPKGLDLLFSQMLDMDDQDEHGERGRDAARVAENIPLDEAEDLLKGTVKNVLKAPTDGGGASGFVRRKLLTTLVRKIELVTLAEFRSEDQSGSGVDLILVRDSLGQEIDDRLLGLVRAASKKTTLLFAVGLVLASFLVTWGINQAPFL
jgi:hypothetical protein